MRKARSRPLVAWTDAWRLYPHSHTQVSHWQKQSGSGKLTAGVKPQSLSDYEKNHTRSLCGVNVTAFTGSRQGCSLSPNYNPADHCTSYRPLLHYRKGKNECSSITSDTLSFRCDWSQPTRWQIWWQERTASLCTCIYADIIISCWHRKQQWNTLTVQL